MAGRWHTVPCTTKLPTKSASNDKPRWKELLKRNPPQDTNPLWTILWKIRFLLLPFFFLGVFCACNICLLEELSLPSFYRRISKVCRWYLLATVKYTWWYLESSATDTWWSQEIFADLDSRYHSLTTKNRAILFSIVGGSG